MSVRRRAIKTRVTRERALQRGSDEMSLSLRRLQTVLDGAKAKGMTSITPEYLAIELKKLEVKP